MGMYDIDETYTFPRIGGGDPVDVSSINAPESFSPHRRG